MRDLFTVFSYTFFENARKKVYIISTIITLVITISVLCVPAIMKYVENNQKSSEGQNKVEQNKGVVYVVDSNGLFKDDMEKLKKSFTGYDFKLETANNISKLKEQVKAKDNTTLMVIDQKEGVPRFDYWVKQYRNGADPDVLSGTMKGIFAGRILKNANMPEKLIQQVLSNVSYDVKELGKGMMKSYISCMVVIMLMFFAIYFYSYGVSMSVASEKTSRVMELLLTSTRPSRIILGKSIAMGLLGLCQFLLVLIAAALTYKISFPKDFAIAGQAFDFSNFTPLAVSMIIIYFLLGYSLYAMLNAVAGATVSKAEDVNAAIMPISMITLIAFYFAYGSVSFPNSSVSIAASIIPFSSPFAMPSRLLMAEVPVWQIGLSVAILTFTIVFMAWISIRLYSAAVLHYGKRLKIPDLFKMSKQ